GFDARSVFRHSIYHQDKSLFDYCPTRKWIPYELPKSNFNYLSFLYCRHGGDRPDGLPCDQQLFRLHLRGPSFREFCHCTFCRGFRYEWLAPDGSARCNLSFWFVGNVDCNWPDHWCLAQLVTGRWPSAGTYRSSAQCPDPARLFF